MLTFGSTFAGIGGFDRALEAGGMRCAWQVEMDDDCNRVLARHFPGVPRYRDIREVTADELERVDVLTGGVPCQDWSVAGKRAGLAGKRSGLFFDFARLADMLAPTWVLFENVPGLLPSGPECGCERCEEDRAFALRYKTSEKRSREVEAAWRRIRRHKQALAGEDFATVLECLTGFRPTVPEGGWRNSGVCVGYKRGAAWRVLDAQYCGVAQRRRRVFLVASPGDGSGPAAVLFEPESCDGDSPPRRQARTEVAGILGGGTDASEDGTGRGVPLAVVPRAFNIVGLGHQGRNHAYETNVSGCLQHKGLMPSGNEAGTVIAVSNDSTPCVTKDVVPTRSVGTGIGLNSAPAIAWTQRTRADGVNVEHKKDVAYTLDAPAGGGRKNGGVVTGMVVRRLTPTECERLQGFPDQWTAHDADGKPVSDSARYRMLGNAVAVPVVQWIGERIIEAHRLTGQEKGGEQ